MILNDTAIMGVLDLCGSKPIIKSNVQGVLKPLKIDSIEVEITGNTKIDKNLYVYGSDSVNTALLASNVSVVVGTENLSKPLYVHGDETIDKNLYVYASNSSNAVLSVLNTAVEVGKEASNKPLIVHGNETLDGILTFNKAKNDVSGNSITLLTGCMGVNDYWGIAAGATASDSGFLEIFTSDGGTEPIYVRQYSGNGDSKKITRTLTLLDSKGNTSIPGKLEVGGEGIEIHAAEPYIDFHYGKSTADYTSRIIESSSGTLEISNNLKICGKIIAQPISYGTGDPPTTGAVEGQIYFKII